MNDWRTYAENMIRDLTASFGKRLCYVGLQGSYLRGEAHEDSDLDLMVVIDALTPADLDTYRACLANRGDSIPSCGFLCGRDELAAWNPQEILHLRHSTKDLYGTLDALLPQVTLDDHRRYVQFAAGNLYHALCHRYVHGSKEGRAISLGSHEKELFFLLQDLHFLREGKFAQSRVGLYEMLPSKERAVWDAVKEARDTPDFCGYDTAFSLVFAWCRDVMVEIADRK